LNLFEDVILPILIAVEYFALVYLTVLPTIPDIAIQAALVATIPALVAYLILKNRGMATHTAPIFVLTVAIPFALGLCVIGAWLVRLIELWLRGS